LLATAQQCDPSTGFLRHRDQGAVQFVLGAAELPVDPPAAGAPTALLSKMEAGAEFIQTQFCMDPEAVRRYAARLLDLGIAQKLPILIASLRFLRALGALDEREALRSA